MPNRIIFRINTCKRCLKNVRLRQMIKKIENSIPLKIMGIDLAGKPVNPTGICILEHHFGELKVSVETLFSDDKIIAKVRSVDPSLIVIDAPLSLPQGRCCLEKDCECAAGGHFRKSEREIRKYGPVLPLTFTGMKMLTLRGVYLSSVLAPEFKLKETHPRTAQKILGFENFKDDIQNYLNVPTEANEHELDAILAALTGYCYLNSSFVELGDEEEGTLILPKGRECLKNIKIENK